jgi:hypothetical protein
LPVSLAEGAIAVSMGQLRLNDTTVHVSGAGLKLAASIDLVQSAIDARLLLAKMADGAGEPEILISVKGPIAAPKRTLDIGKFASWLALRAADLQTKQLDALQSTRQAPIDPSDSPVASVPTVPVLIPPASPPPHVSRPPPETTPAIPRLVRPRHPAPMADQPPALPPPIDIRPLGAPRPARTDPFGPRVDGVARPPRPPLSPPPPTARSNGAVPVGP